VSERSDYSSIRTMMHIEAVGIAVGITVGGILAFYWGLLGIAWVIAKLTIPAKDWVRMEEEQRERETRAAVIKLWEEYRCPELPSLESEQRRARGEVPKQDESYRFSHNFEKWD